VLLRGIQRSKPRGQHPGNPEPIGTIVGVRERAGTKDGAIGKMHPLQYPSLLFGGQNLSAKWKNLNRK
jgi:hypothetical protein